ncbi:amino acid adenylation domain-containing protein [Labrys okinawensis]|uniref:amino acid adenylation domain-containing protein n=1 Tax=Labrys okinawensis TaxID=346911 RepID=UPI0039BCCC36
MIDIASERPLHALISLQAASRRDGVAVTCGEASVTFAELEARSNQLAHRLLKMGAGPGRLIAIGLERSIDMVVGLLGILKSGAGYLPLDPGYPRERLAFTLDDARPVAFVTTSTGRPSLPESNVPVVLLDSDAASLAEEPSTVPDIAEDLDSLAYVIYTSGSTGKPKGCQVTHRNVARLFSATEHWFGFGPQDVWTFFHSHAFDFSVWEIWGALIYGGRVVVVPYVISRSPAEFLDLLVREKVTVLNQTPSAFRTLIEADRRSDHQPGSLSLRYVIFGGEALELQMLRPWFARHGDKRPQLVNMYGITETTVHVTYRPINLADLHENRGSVIGVPIPDLTVHVLDEARMPTPRGEVGEMYVGGGGVCLGYLNRPELTAERFIEWRSPETGMLERLYKTGDLARRLPDGDLEYLGRSDDQVKIRGFRIETGEIESQLIQHSGVNACAVIARKDGLGGEARLVAYVVPAATSATAAELRAHLAQTLPDYMLPSAFVELAALPMTENGKLDRKALPAPAIAVAPILPEARDELEQRIVTIWARVLGVPQVSTSANFFDQGGSSLQMVTVLNEIQESVHPHLRMNDLFERPTIKALAAFIRGSTTPQSAALNAGQLRARQQAEALQRLRQRQSGGAK